MQIKTVLNKCHPLKSFVYDKVHFVTRKGESEIEVQIVARKNSKAICSVCKQAAPLYDHLGERRFEFIPLWGFAVFFYTECAG